ncbi:MAG: hypothetical protein HN337_03270 [Deltaproteobacteria bacterium]|nr:hypothetical protein [Deltaproteobacteria bacterium]
MASETVTFKFGGSCRSDREVRGAVITNTDAYCRANKKGHEASVLEIRPGERHGSKDVYKCTDGWFEVWVKFRCK